jgi:hypothetical protein
MIARERTKSIVDDRLIRFLQRKGQRTDLMNALWKLQPHHSLAG